MNRTACQTNEYQQVFGSFHPPNPQGMYFNRIAATKGEKDDFAIARFGNEAQRCLKMLETWSERKVKFPTSGGIHLGLDTEGRAEVGCLMHPPKGR